LTVLSVLICAFWVSICAAAPEFIWQGLLLALDHVDTAELLGALLIGLVLAHAGLIAEMIGFAPVLLLDEVVAHLDPDRRVALYTELETLGAQVFMTGADPAAFAEIGTRADIFDVSPGLVRKRA